MNERASAAQVAVGLNGVAPAGVGPGTKLGRYEVLVPIAQGGMASVWAARLRGSRGFEKLVAIKTMLPGMVDDPKFERMFLAEAEVASRIRHPNVVEVLELGEEAGVLYLVLEWVDGEPLSTIMKVAGMNGGVPLRIGVNLIMQTCAGLHAAHELRDEDGGELALVHRDISPQNILVSYEGVAKVADFGIAKAMALGESTTQLREVKGKIGYLSPEQATRRDIDRRSDVFALGILLYQLATGKHPFRGNTDAETVANILISDPIHGYPKQLEHVLKRCLAKEPDHRYPSATALRKALQTVLPPQQRVTSYEEISEFLKGLLGENLRVRRERFAQAVKAAVELTDRMPMLDVGLTSATDLVPVLVPKRTRQRLLGAGAVLVMAGATFVAVRGQSADAHIHPGAPTATSAPAVADSAIKAEVTAPSALPPSNAVVERSAPSASAASEATTVKRTAKGTPRSTSPKTRTRSTTSAAPGGVLSPVRTPGF